MKKYNKELAKRIDEVLYYVWDPIGVSSDPCARYEYSCYVAGVLKLVKECCDSEPISNYFMSLASEKMGLNSDYQMCSIVAQLLLMHKQVLIDGLETQ